MCALVLLSAAVASAQYNMFLQVAGIPGESVTASHPNTIEPTGFSVGASNTFTSCSADFADLSVSKSLDKTSPLLMLNCANGNTFPTNGIVLYVQRVINGSSRDFYVIKLSNARISSVNNGGTVSGLPTETVTFRFTHVEIDYTPFASNGSAQPPIIMSWDV